MATEREVRMAEQLEENQRVHALSMVCAQKHNEPQLLSEIQTVYSRNAEMIREAK